MCATTRNSGTNPAPALVVSDPMGKQSVPSSRYSLAESRREVQRVVARIGRGAQKAVALGIGITEQAMSAKLRGEHDEMTVEQLGKVANLLGAPAGWPWVPWPETDLLHALPRIASHLGL